MVPALSPSRAADFKQCPLLFRFRTIDKLVGPPSPAAARGTLVHAVLEHLFELPAQERTVDAALALLEPRWAALVDEEPALAAMIADHETLTEETWFTQAAALVEQWFTLEDPTRLEPEARELFVEAEVDGLTLRGYVDRLDVAPDGSMRVVDYKTGRSPGEAFEAKALFQMKFYALVLWRHRGVVRAAESGDWRPRTSRLCDWCDFTAYCPSFGGTPPPLPPDAARLAIDPSRSGEATVADD